MDTAPVPDEGATVDGLTEALRGAVRPQGELPPMVAESGGEESGFAASDGWDGDDLETAYRKALEAMEQAWETAATVLPEPVVETQQRLADSAAEAAPPLDSPGQTASLPAPASTSGPVTGTAIPSQAVAAATTSDGVPLQALTPIRVLEAILFVGGQPIALTKLARLIGESVEPQQISSWVDEMNTQYAEENRPYEIRYSSGGYHLELRPEYEKLRQRVYGVGPREVKLSQEVLEVLALVAYQQPITAEAVAGHGKAGAASILRQLLRRDLVAIERSSAEGEGKVVAYRTTERFLQLFSLRSLADLPRPDDVDTK